METPRDAVLWRKAKKRAAFKVHLSSYLIVNGGLWLLFFLTSRDPANSVMWPIFPTLGWGIGLASHYFAAYGKWDEHSLAQREYDKLTRQ